MKKQLTNQDIKDLIDSKDYNIAITRPSANSFKVHLTPLKETCFSCNELIDIDNLEVRLDTRVTAIMTPKKFCSSCVKIVDKILKNLKTNQSKDWFKK